MATIALINGGVTEVDDGDFERVAGYRWRAHKAKGGNLYARARTPGNKYVHVLLHRILLGAKRGEIVDHIDGDSLNNTRANLRVCSFAQNAQNAARRSNSKLPFKGVRRSGRGWYARIGFDGQVCEIRGSIQSSEEAAAAYDIAAVLAHGEFACLNFPHVWPEVPSRRKA